MIRIMFMERNHITLCPRAQPLPFEGVFVTAARMVVRHLWQQSLSAKVFAASRCPER